MNSVAVQQYDWRKELEETVVASLATTFGLNFLLFKDKMGGNVDTIHNVRKGVWATDAAKQQYDERGDYDSHAYHSDKRFIDKGRKDKRAQQDSGVHDAYTGKKISAGEKRDLDHVIAAKEVHDDAGRVLAGIDGVELANKESNLQSTSSIINRSKKSLSANEYLEKRPELIEGHKKTLLKMREKLEEMPTDTPQQQHEKREQEDKIKKQEEKIKKLESIDEEAMRKRDEEARREYEQEINRTYYTSSKFLLATAKDAGLTGVKMGAREVLGLVLAEIWFELRNRFPRIVKRIKRGFSLKKFLHEFSMILKGIWKRVKARFADFLENFKNGVFGGVMASITTTVINIFFTTQKLAAQIIRETWKSLSKAIKLIFFNPEKLSPVDLWKAVTGLISASVAAALGLYLHSQLAPVLTLPFGAELASLVSSLVTGAVTIGLTYFLIHSDTSKKVWRYLQGLLMPGSIDLAEYQRINAEADNYLQELGRVEFGVDVERLEDFYHELLLAETEAESAVAIEKELKRRKIDVGYKMGDAESIRKFLKRKV